MEKYFKRKTTVESSSPPKRNKSTSNQCSVEVDLANATNLPANPKSTSKQYFVEVDLANLPADPGLRVRISDYDPNIQDQVRRAYYQKGPCQPRNHTFPQKSFGRSFRRFNPAWFNEFPNWLEYSIAKDSAFCLCCYLFKSDIGEQSGGESFVGEGFSNWKKKERLRTHVGGPNSAHNQALKNCEALLNQNQHIQTFFNKQSDEARRDYRIRLGASINCIRFLLRQGLPFRGHDESENSSNRGNFLELLIWLCDRNAEVKAVSMENAPENQKLVSPKIQKDIVSAISTEIIIEIMRDVGDKKFSILVDESRDVSTKEQMAIVLRYVDRGHVIERFVGIEHVTSTTAISLKEVIDGFFSRHGLSISNLRGQGYDGASNMQGGINGLKTLILKENECAYYVHCFAHQLQLAIVGLAKKHTDVMGLFTMVANVVNVVGSSAKRRDVLRGKHADLVFEAVNNGEISSGQGLNQEISLQRAGDTRWSSHYNSLISLIKLFPSVIEVLDMIAEDGESDQRYPAKVLLDSIQSYEFIFSLHLMKTILGITSDLSQALQRKDQDIVNAMNLVSICKGRLQTMRDDGWDSLVLQVSSFCEKNAIEVLNMDDMFLIRGRSRRKAPQITNMHYYRVELFYAVIDMQLQELNNRFSETTTELLLCVACLNPSESFSAFDKEKLIRLAKFYPKDFSDIELVVLDDQLENYIIDMRSNDGFSRLKGITDLAEKLVETKKDRVYPLVYLLLTLALILPVATASVERVFSAMNIVKTRLRNRMGDQWMNDNMIAYVERDIFDRIDNEIIIQRFQNMKTRRGQL